MQHHTHECEVRLRQHAGERLEATGTLPSFDHPQQSHVQEERHHADGDGGWRIAVSRYCISSLLRRPGLTYYTMQVLRFVRRYG